MVLRYTVPVSEVGRFRRQPFGLLLNTVDGHLDRRLRHRLVVGCPTSPRTRRPLRWGYAMSLGYPRNDSELSYSLFGNISWVELPHIDPPDNIDAYPNIGQWVLARLKGMICAYDALGQATPRSRQSQAHELYAWLWESAAHNQPVHRYRSSSTAQGTDDWEIADGSIIKQDRIGSGTIGSFIMARASPTHRGCDTRRRACRACFVHRSGELISKGCAHHWKGGCD